jgi:hypothetical protein
MLQEILDSPLLMARHRLRLLGLLLLLRRGRGAAAPSAVQVHRPLAARAGLPRRGAGAGVVALGTKGYRAFDTGEVAARLSVRPTGPQRFIGHGQFPDGRSKRSTWRATRCTSTRTSSSGSRC